jgi:ATP-dependent DNA helicase RecG
MALPINVDSLVHGNTVEWERLEFKKGWNPEDVIHSMCAFANDLHNWGGGYIIIRIAENNGQPILPPEGINQNLLDGIQGEIIKLSNRIWPNYFPIVQPYQLQSQYILVMWCPAGDNRPYTAPTTLGANAQRQSYIRMGSRSIVARDQNMRSLQELAARIPFDDRVNNQATMNDLDLGLIQAYLQEVRSSLLNESTKISFEDLCRTMLIAKGPIEDIRPANIGLLFFCRQPERFFDRAWIEVVLHDDSNGDRFREVYFKGPVQKQLRDTLSFIQVNVIKETVVKLNNKAEANRYFNFPFKALEEALSNAVYHKSYEIGSPIEVQIFSDKITILSHPGPMPPVNAQVLSNQKRIIAREYRNRRIGDFLKELNLTEGRGTGFPAIYDAMKSNGSPDPIFETDENTFVLVTLPVHQNVQASDQANKFIFNTLADIVAFCDQASDQASDQARTIVKTALHNKVEVILVQLDTWTKSEDLFENMGLSNHSTNRKKYLEPLLKNGWISMEYPQSPTHPDQRYKRSPSGTKLLKLIS